MIRCWKDDTNITDYDRTWEEPYTEGAQQDDTVPYL